MTAVRIEEFDTWRAGYGLATVNIYQAGTTTPASVFTDEALSVAAANPQTLAERTSGGISYGKFSAPLYVGVAYELLINSIDTTGVARPPITTLVAADASDATVLVTGGSVANALDDQLARRVDVRDYGEFLAVGTPSASASTNNATIVSAIGAAGVGGVGDAVVKLPAGTYSFTDFTLPQGVVLDGAGPDFTILQSTVADKVVTIGGTRAGLSALTLDGVSLPGGSIGVYAQDIDNIVLDNVVIKRFELGFDNKGGQKSAWFGLSFSDCTNGYQGEGNSSSNNEHRFNHWRGGTVELCSGVGVLLKNAGRACENDVIADVIFDTNTGTAVKITGARASALRDCRWLGNTENLHVDDATPTTTLNTVIGLEVIGGDMNGGTVSLNNNLDTVTFRQLDLTNVAVTLTSPAHNVHVEDCRENAVTIAGDTTAWRRHNVGDRNSSALTTTDATITKGWAITLQPGQFANLVVKVVGRQINGYGWYFHHIGSVALRPGSSLAYNLQTGNFTPGNVLTGGTSGATARIIVDTDGGATGTLTLYDIVGTFQNGEVITDGSGGSASVNGAIVHARSVIITGATLNYNTQTANFTEGATITGGTSGATAIIGTDTDGGATGSMFVSYIDGLFVANEIITDGLGGSATTSSILQNASFAALRSSVEQNNNGQYVTFAANNAQIEFRVAGLAGATIEWTLDVDVTLNYHAAS